MSVDVLIEVKQLRRDFSAIEKRLCCGREKFRVDVDRGLFLSGVEEQ
jgi:hypothetical protein